MMMNAELQRGLLSMMARAIGKDQLAAGQRGNGVAECGMGRQRCAVNFMDKGQKFSGINMVQIHQPAQGGAIFLIIGFLQVARLHSIQRQLIGDEGGDARVNFRPEIGMGRVERIVEVEHPGVDFGKGLL